MKKKIYFWSLALLMMMVVSCREESDAVRNYAYYDGLTFSEAEKSFAGKFKLLWNALNQNYAIWDYERSMGLDWDAVYDEYLPKYEALDQRSDVTDDELKALLTEIVAPLHDGHFVAQMKNHQTGGFVTVIPSNLRVAQRDDYSISQGFVPSLNAYFPTSYGGNGEIVQYAEANTIVLMQVAAFYRNPDQGYPWAEQEAERLKQKSTLTDKETFVLQGLNNFIAEFDQFISLVLSLKLSESAILQSFNTMAMKYQYLGIPGFNTINSAFLKTGIEVKYALFRNNVAYFYLSGFSLTPYVSEENPGASIPGADSHTQALANQVHDVWKMWFDAVQNLHANGQLRGVIIDVRSNGGGMLNDYQYVLGSLLPSGGFELAKARFKRGLGRYDYSPLAPSDFPTLETPHEAITEPVVVLCNCGSVSMAEMTSLGCKKIPNGTLIGKTTHGGLCGLHGGSSSYSLDYAGIIGEQDVTPVWLYIPTMVTMSDEGQIYEGIGITPDITVSYDPTLAALGRDTQLERALQFLNTGN